MVSNEISGTEKINKAGRQNIIEILGISEYEFWAENQNFKVGNNGFFMCGKIEIR